MIINNVQFNADLMTILTELQSQLRANNIPYLQKIKDAGDNIMVQCPYHGNGQERRPSAGISKETGVFHCFACNSVYQLHEMISFVFDYYDDMLGIHGWNWLLKNFVAVEAATRNDIDLFLERNPQRRIDTPDLTKFVSEEELDSYRYIHPYMYERKLTDEVIKRFDIGYDKNTRCLTFPIRNILGLTLFIARRSVDTKYFNYPAGSEKPLYGLYELYQLDKFPNEVYICESMIDALTIWCYNKYAVALNGLGNKLSIAQIKKLPCRKVILATDKDDAGKKARIRLRKELNNKIVTELDYRTYPDHAKDINDMTREEFYALGEVF